jgi:hypothetical protein
MGRQAIGGLYIPPFGSLAFKVGPSLQLVFYNGKVRGVIAFSVRVDIRSVKKTKVTFLSG